MRKSLAYILGFAFGDGNISKDGYLVRLYEENLEFLKATVKPRFVESFGTKPGISYDSSNNSYVLHKRSKQIWNTMRNFGMPAGRKARIITIPDIINSGNAETKSAFVSGVFDAEASITAYSEKDRHPRGYKYLETKMYSPRFIVGLQRLMLDLSREFNPRVYHYDYGSILRLNGREQLRLVSSHLDLMHPRFKRLLAD